MKKRATDVVLFCSQKTEIFTYQKWYNAYIKMVYIKNTHNFSIFLFENCRLSEEK